MKLLEMRTSCGVLNCYPIMHQLYASMLHRVGKFKGRFTLDLHGNKRTGYAIVYSDVSVHVLVSLHQLKHTQYIFCSTFEL